MASAISGKIKEDLKTIAPLYDIRTKFQWVKLFFVLELWAVLFFRMEEFIGSRKSLLYFPLRMALMIMKPFVHGMTGARLCHGAEIGGGLVLHYSPGVVVADKAVIGKYCTLFTGAAVVHKANSKGEGAPVIGDHVKLGIGCKVIGAVRVGNHATVGANAVVLTDIPDHGIAVGIPAKVINAATLRNDSQTDKRMA